MEKWHPLELGVFLLEKDKMFFNFWTKERKLLHHRFLSVLQQLPFGIVYEKFISQKTVAIWEIISGFMEIRMNNYWNRSDSNDNFLISGLQKNIMDIRGERISDCQATDIRKCLKNRKHPAETSLMVYSAGCFLLYNCKSLNKNYSITFNHPSGAWMRPIWMPVNVS